MSNTKRTTLCSILAGLLLWLPAAVMAAPVNDTFDHFTTGFSLTGGHRAVECDACHTAGQFRGTPRECASCHTILTNTGAVVKTSAHIQSNNACDVCHSTLAWDDVRRVNHMAVLGNCKSCHTLGGAASSRPPSDGIHNNLAGRDCIDCHRTSTWVSVHFNHAANVGTFRCNDCHFSPASSGAIQATKPPSGGLHGKGPITGRTLDCNSCHNTHSWNFSHAGITAPCSDCHKNSLYDRVITQKPTNDFHTQTTLECNACHSTRAWSPAGWDHRNARYYPNHSFTRLSCRDCHGTSGVYSFAFPNGVPDCISCHLSDWQKERKHHNSESADHYCQRCHEHSNALSRGKW
jgi:hypothetical protein